MLKLGRRRKAKESIYIRNETLDRPEIAEIGVLGALDCISNHLSRPSMELRLGIGRLEGIYVEKCNIRRSIELNLVDDVEVEMDRLRYLTEEWNMLVHRIGSIDEWSVEEISCSRSTYYEVLLNEYKNRIIALQGALDKDSKYKREWLLSRRKRYSVRKVHSIR